MTKITKRLFSAMKERNEELINEYSAELQAKWRSINESGNPDMKVMLFLVKQTRL